MVRTVLLGIIVVACVIRLIGLEYSPPGFFYDEATGAAHSMCYQETGRDLFGERGLFSRVDFSGYQSAPFLMGGALWTSVFGTGPGGFRSFIAFASVVTILAVYLLARNLVRNQDYALWAAALAACMPWAFHFSRISWDAPLGVAFLMWGMALVYWKTSGSALQTRDWIRVVTAALLFILASYCYSPLRIQAGLMVLLLPGIRWQPRILILALFALGNLAVLMYYLNPEFASRAQLLALTSDDIRNPFRGAGMGGLVAAYVQQLLAHFSPQFLLLSGDANLRHSIQSHGMLDWLSFAGLVTSLYFIVRSIINRKTEDHGRLLLIAVALLGIFAGFTPAALTWDSTPHALRSIGAWPFIALLAAFGLTSLLRRASVQLAACGLVAVLFGGYLYSYFVKYPEISEWWYDKPLIQLIKDFHLFPDHYQPVVRAYYRMAEFGESCESVLETM